MKKLVVLLGAVLATGLLFAGTCVWKPDSSGGSGNWADGTRWEGGTVPKSGDTVEIPAGLAVVNNADATLFKSLGGVTFTSNEAVLRFDDTSMSDPFPKDGFLVAAAGNEGMVIKNCSQTWTLATKQSAYLGSFDIAQGLVRMKCADSLGCSTVGSSAAPAVGEIWVRSGATIDFGSQYAETMSAFTFGYRRLHIAGTGTDNQGAIFAGKQETIANAIHFLVLEDDASIGSVASAYLGLSAGSVDLNGNHTLSTAYDAAYIVRVENEVFTNSVEGAKGVVCIGAGSTTKQQKMSLQGANTTFGSTDAVSVSLVNCGRIYYRNTSVKATSCPLAIAGTNAGFMSWTSEPATFTTNVNNWVGPVTLSGNATFFPEGGIKRMTVSGKISGTGDVTLVCSSSGYGAKCTLANAANDFTGNVVSDGTYGGGIEAFFPGSIPDFEKVSVKGTRVTVRGENWPTNKIVELGNAMTYDNVNNTHYGAIAIDPEGCGEDSTFPIALKDGDITNPNFAIGADGTGTVVLEESPASTPIGIAAFDGTLKISGTHALGRAVIASDGAASHGTVLVEDADVSVGSFPWVLGYFTTSQGSGNYGTLTLRNAKLMNHASTTFTTWEGFLVGCYNRGRMVIEEGCAITNRLQMAWGQTGGRGEVIQNGGLFHAWGSSSENENCVTKIGTSGNAYYELNGGVFAHNGYVSLGYDNGSSGVFYQHGGVISNSMIDVQTAFRVGMHGGGSDGTVTGIYYNDGGLYTSPNGYPQIQIAKEGRTDAKDTGTVGVATVDGEDAVVNINNCTYMAGGKNSTAILNLNNGGSWSSWSIRSYGKGAAGAKAYVNFNGGTVKTTSGPTVFGTPGDSRNPVDKVTVFEKGATVLASSQALAVPLDAPTGNGVTGITWTDTTTSYPGAPAVRIEGDGFGASAIALYDSNTGRISGFRITSPGCNYTTATAKIRWGGGTVKDAACTLGENARTGGARLGAVNSYNTLTLDAANTYQGPTEIVGSGTVAATTADGTFNPKAFGTSKTLTLTSGTLDLKGGDLKDFGFTDVRFCGGTVKNDAGAVTLPDGAVTTLDVAAVKDGSRTYEIPAGVTLPDDYEVNLVNADAVDPADKRYYILTLPANFAGLPKINGVPEGWAVARSGNRVKLYYQTGLILFVR